MTNTYHLLNQISDDQDDWTIKVRVARMWDALQYKTNELLALDMVLLDEQGTLIHASIRKELADKFRSKLEEGKIYLIRNFRVKDNKKNFKVIDHKYMINIFPTTYVKEIKAAMPKIQRHKFQFLPFDQIPSRANNDTLLTDVIGVLTAVGPIEERKTSDVKRTITLLDNKQQKINVELWANFAHAIGDDVLHKENEITTMVLTSARVREFMGKIFISSSFSTRLYVDIDIPEALDLKNSFVESTHKVEPLLTTEGSSVHVDDWITEDKKEITEIFNILSEPEKKVHYVNCMARIRKIETEFGWYYVSCKKCFKKVKPFNSRFYCGNCNTEADSPVARYRIQAQVEDASGKASFVIFDKEAEKLIQIPVTELWNQNEKEEDEEILPEEIKKIIGKICIFKLKIDEYNFGQSRPIITVRKLYNMDDIPTEANPDRICDKVSEHYATDQIHDIDKKKDVAETQVNGLDHENEEDKEPTLQQILGVKYKNKKRKKSHGSSFSQYKAI